MQTGLDLLLVKSAQRNIEDLCAVVGRQAIYSRSYLNYIFKVCVSVFRNFAMPVNTFS